MSKNEVLNHAKKYSQSYRYDLNGNKSSSKWSTDFDAMALKTVIKMLLSKWGILSIEMQKAIQTHLQHLHWRITRRQRKHQQMKQQRK